MTARARFSYNACRTVKREGSTGGPPSRIQKESHARELFSTIAPRYDFFNALLSGGRHASWRKKAVDAMNLHQGGAGLDVCCGTGDMAFEMMRRCEGRGVVVGVDFCEPMLDIAKRKAATFSGRPTFVAARADRLPFADSAFDCAGIAFGLRNVPDVGETLSEMARVVRCGGRVVSLEIFGVRGGLLGALWRLYFHNAAPRVVQALGGTRPAYDYLSESVAGFLTPEQMAERFERCGLRCAAVHRLAMGSVCIHVGVKDG